MSAGGATSVDVVALGEAMIELNQTRPGEPTYLQGFGGDTSNAVVAAARSGARAAYVTRIGDDELGRMLLRLWADEQVDTRAVAVDAFAPTGVYFVHHGAGGHSFSYLRAGSAASRLRVEELPLALLREARCVHASGISLAISSSAADSVLAAFAAARQAGAKVSFDPNLRLKLWPLARARALIGAAAALADWFFPSLDDARVLSGLSDRDAIVDWAHRLGPPVVFLKLGAEGVIVSDGGRREHLPGWSVDARDGTGAGDCFCGAALACLTRGETVLEAARYANAAAALSTTGFGAVAPVPRRDEVLRLLAAGHAVTMQLRGERS
jgi:2-dehydro-3-deoxygluconokinase